MSSRKYLCALLAGLTLLAGCTTAQPEATETMPPATVAPITYTTRTVEYATYTKTVQGSAEATYPVQQTLTCPVSNGILKEYPTLRNTRVKAGDVLAVFEVPEDPIRTKELTLQLNRVRKAFETGMLERSLAVEEALAAAGQLTGTAQEIALLKAEKLQVAYNSYVYETQKSIAALEEQLATLQETTGEITLTAPFDALVTKVVNFTVGEPVAKGTGMIVLRSTDRFYLKTSSNVGRLRYNMALTITSGSNTFTGRVIAVGSMLPAELSVGYALIQAEAGITYDQIGKNTSFRGVEQVAENVIVVEQRLLSRDSNGHYVYVLENGAPAKRLVKIGPSNNGECWILDGLVPGDRLITG